MAGRFYVDLTLTVYADTEDDAIDVAQRVAETIEGSETVVRTVDVGDIREDKPEEEG